MKKTYKKYEVRFAYTALLPIFSLYLLLRIWPILQALFLSLTDKSLFKRKFSIIGLENYVTLLTRDRDFLISLQNTLLFALYTMLVTLTLALVIALIMHRRRIAWIGALQGLIFIPVVISVVPCAIIWKWIYDPQFGILNYILSFFGGPQIGWLVDPRFSLYSVVGFVVWKWLGFYLVIFWVGLNAIPKTYIEAAQIDGAREAHIIFLILLPLLKPILLFATVMATIKGFTIFSEVYVMTVGSQGAPGNMVKVFTYDIYERAFVYGKIGQANSEAVIMFLLLLVFAVAQIKLNRKREIG